MDELEKDIVAYLNENNFCVLTTSDNNVPHATPIHYGNIGLDIVILTSSGIKLKTIPKNNRVSLAVSSPTPENYGTDITRGAQIEGRAELIPYGDEGFENLIKDSGLLRFLNSIGISRISETAKVIKVVPDSIKFIDLTRKDPKEMARWWRRSE